MTIQRSFQYHTIESLKKSDFLDNLVANHLQSLKEMRTKSERGVNLSKTAPPQGWKPHLKEIIRQVSAWPPKERIVGMPLHKYLEAPAIESLHEANSWSSVSQVPESYIRPCFVAKCVSKNRAMLDFLPSFVQTEGFYMNMITRDGLSLSAIPEQRISIPMCERAVGQNGMALKHVPKEFQSSIMCLLAIENDPMALGLVPRSRISPALCHAAVRRDGMSLIHVPIPMRTVNICQVATSRSPEARIHVPDEIRLAIRQMNSKRIRVGGHSFG